MNSETGSKHLPEENAVPPRVRTRYPSYSEPAHPADRIGQSESMDQGPEDWRIGEDNDWTLGQPNNEHSQAVSIHAFADPMLFYQTYKEVDHSA